MEAATRTLRYRRTGKLSFRSFGSANRFYRGKRSDRALDYFLTFLWGRFAAATMVAATLSFLWTLPATASDHSWVGNTSGPFFTGTADAEPYGSWYYEPFFFDAIESSTAQINALQKFAFGLPLDMELDLSIPLICNLGTTAQNTPLSYYGFGDVAIQLKKQVLTDSDVYNILADPSLAVIGGLTIPTGNYENLSPGQDGIDQSGNGTYDLDLGMELHKQADPFQFYLEVADYLIFPADVRSPYAFNNGEALPLGTSLHMVDGNLLYYAAALEHVLDPKIGFGYLIEIYGETQSHSNLVFGPATAPDWSALWLAPELEVTWPNEASFSITWGAGVAFPVAEDNYPRTLIPMATATFYFNSGGAR